MFTVDVKHNTTTTKFHVGNLEHMYTQYSHVAMAYDTFSHDTAVLHLSSNIFHWQFLLVVIASFFLVSAEKNQNLYYNTEYKLVLQILLPVEAVRHTWFLQRLSEIVCELMFPPKTTVCNNAIPLRLST